MRRDRAGCWICMDEVLAFETCEFGLCVRREVGRGEAGVGGVGDEPCWSRSWSLDLSPVGNALGGGATPPTSRVSSPRSPERTRRLGGIFPLHGLQA